MENNTKAENFVIGTILVLVGAFLLFLVGLGFMHFTNQWFGLSVFGFIFEFIFAVIILGLISAIGFGIIYGITAIFKNDTNAGVITGIRGTVLAALLIYLFVGHFVASYNMANLKIKFNNVIETTKPTLTGRKDPDAPGSDYNYGGKLDAVVKERDAQLTAKGYYPVFGWTTNKVWSVYIYIPFRWW